MAPKVKIVPSNHTEHKPMGGKASPLIYKLRSVPTCTTDEDDSDEIEDCNTSGMPSHTAFLLPQVH